MEKLIYDVKLSPGSKIDAISLVDKPAIEINYLKFSQVTKKAKRVFTGVAMLADTPIYRLEDDVEYFIRFPKDVLRELATDFLDRTDYLVNLQHSDEVINNIRITESYFIDYERGICPKEFNNLPDGSWIVSLKVDDDITWNKLSNRKDLTGFSIECSVDIEISEESKLQSFLEQLI